MQIRKNGYRNLLRDIDASGRTAPTYLLIGRCNCDIWRRTELVENRIQWRTLSPTELNTVCSCRVEVKLRPTVSRPVCLGVGLSSGTHDKIFGFCLTLAGFCILGSLSDERIGLQFTRTIASGPCQTIRSRVEVPKNSDHILLIWDCHNLEGKMSVFIPSSNRHWVPLSLPLTTHRATLEVF
jgi:hypothetical protein